MSHRHPGGAAVFAAVLLAVCPAARALAQNGTIVGKVRDPQGNAIGGATVEVLGGTPSAATAIDGRYTLTGVPAGQVSLRARMIGYQAKTVTDLRVKAGDILEFDLTLPPSVTQLQEVTVTAAAERGSVQAATELQRNAVTLLNTVSSEQISRSPDADAAQVVQRMTGLTLQDGKYLFVRGLGERYTAAALNGVRLPSAEQERKMVPLDLFPAGFLQGVVTRKAFTPDQPGDISGATVDLQTKEFPAARQVQFSVSGGFNTSVTGRTVLSAPMLGNEWLGFRSGARDLPSAVRAAGDLRGLSTSQANQLIGLFRNTWSADSHSGRPNGGMGLSVGGEDGFLGQRIGYLFSLSYGYSTEARLGETRGLAVGTGTTGRAQSQNVYEGEAGRASILWGGIANLSTHVDGGRLRLTNTYTRSVDNEASVLTGENEEFGRDFQFTRLTFVERTVRSTQVSGEHPLTRRAQVDWKVTNAHVTRDEPDRSDIGYEVQNDPSTGGVEPTMWFGQARFATRTFGELDEHSWDFAGNVRYDFGSARPLIVKVGGLRRTATRSSSARAYDLINRTLTQRQLSQSPEQIFTTQAAEAGQLLLQANALAGVYDAEERVSAGYVQFETNLTDWLHVVTGARIEDWRLDVRTRSVTGTIVSARPRARDVLPALAVNVLLSDQQNLRFAASQTVSRPEYRELSPVPYFEQVGLMTTFGNPRLNRAVVKNLDVRYEFFPSGGEILSVGVFAKRFDHPIEKVIVLQAGAQALSYVNAESGSSLGMELEARKRVTALFGGEQAWTASGNLTLMRSRITPGSSVLTNANRPMVGQSGYVVNAGLTYAPPASPMSASVLYNVTGRRIAEAGASGLPDAYEEARHMVDLSAEFRLAPTISLKADAKNLLNSPYRMTQGGVFRHRYSTGPQVGFRFAWQP